jgi:hypothetical protein
MELENIFKDYIKRNGHFKFEKAEICVRKKKCCIGYLQ